MVHDMRRLLKFRAGYGSQVLVFDATKVEARCSLDYSDHAYSQGYAAIDGAIAFFTITEYGLADFSIWEGSPAATAKYSKKVEARLVLTSGQLCVQQPEEPPVILAVAPGEYDVVFAQTQEDDVEDFLEIDVFLDRNEGER
jgi:hypothetical protein